MNFKRIAAAAAALCLTACTLPGYGAYMPEVGNTSAYDEDAENNNKVVLAAVGDTTTVSLAGTTETPKWKSDDESIATVESSGGLSATITATGKGSTSVYAVLSKQTIRFDVTVLRASKDELIPIDGGSITLTQQNNKALVNIDIPADAEVIWKSSDEKVAVVNGKGEITAVGKGNCIISALYAGYEYKISVTSEYEPAEPAKPVEICIGEITLTNTAPSQKLKFPEDAEIIFMSTDESVATISDDGIIMAVGEGTCRIYAYLGDTASYVEVTSTYKKKEPITDGGNIGSVTLTSLENSRKITLNIIPDDAAVTWSSSDESIAVVSAGGVVIAVSEGTCVVTADVGGVKYTIDVTVEIENGFEFEVVTMQGVGSTLSLDTSSMGKNIRFTSTDTSVVTVDKTGKVTAVKEGFAVIMAESDSALSYVRIKVVKRGMAGDANCDGAVTIADATAILQYVGNRDKYGLSEEGLLNGDVDGSKGVTAIDSLVVQMFDAKVISSLPYDFKEKK